MSEREQSSRNFPRPTLRPEALPLAWDQLTKTQKQAFGDIVGWLAAAVADLPREERDGRQPQAGSVANGCVLSEQWTRD